MSMHPAKKQTTVSVSMPLPEEAVEIQLLGSCVASIGNGAASCKGWSVHTKEEVHAFMCTPTHTHTHAHHTHAHHTHAHHTHAHHTHTHTHFMVRHTHVPFQAETNVLN